MRRFFLRFLLVGALTMGSAGLLGAQELPPAEPPAPMPHAAPAPAELPGGEASLRVVTNEVLVPTLVERKNGEVIYGLKPTDFILEDNGQPQRIRVEEEMDTAPVALAVVVEMGGAGQLEFDKLAHLGPLLELFLGDPASQAALIGFDSKPHLLVDFTHSQAELTAALRGMDPGDGSDAILDTVGYAVERLNEQPKAMRRVLLLVSEKRDHGSRHSRIPALIRQIGSSDVLVLSVSFSPARAELAHDVKDSGEDRTLNLFSTVAMVAQAFRKNVARELARMSGGEYATFAGDRRFELEIAGAARRVRNRYLISFNPSAPTPGLHTIRVRTTEDYGGRIIARANYWMAAPPEAGH